MGLPLQLRPATSVHTRLGAQDPAGGRTNEAATSDQQGIRTQRLQKCYILTALTPCPTHTHVVPVAIQHSVFEESQRSLEAHLGERANVTAEPIAVERRVSAISRHVVGNEVEMAIINRDAVTSEYIAELEHDVAAASFHTVHVQNCSNVVRRRLVRVDIVAVLLHGPEIGARRMDRWHIFLLARLRIGDLVVEDKCASSHTGQLLHDSLLDSSLYNVE
ncbi:hypothetical protein HYQ46_001030 [Verticillium longisporum]|nr:hypothetical protein HYQ46_001030 [Verticillium longisporum]